MTPELSLVTQESSAITAYSDLQSLRGETERVWIGFLQSDLDLGFTFLRLAEYYRGIGAGALVAGLIAKATLGYRTVINSLGSLSTSCEEERRELRECADRLLDAILAAEQCLDTPCGEG